MPLEIGLRTVFRPRPLPAGLHRSQLIALPLLCLKKCRLALSVGCGDVRGSKRPLSCVQLRQSVHSPRSPSSRRAAAATPVRAAKGPPQRALRGVWQVQQLGDVRFVQQLVGWEVCLKGSGELLGRVVEVLLSNDDPDAGGQPLLRVSRQTERLGGLAAHAPAQAGEEAQAPLLEQHLIPLVPAIVPLAEPHTQRLYITPPEGLLELGRQRLLLKVLEQEVAPYTTEPASAAAARLGIRCMPTKKRLLELGRRDIVSLVQRAGGFEEVALALGLRSAKKPVGYWENPTTLDQELTQFVAAHWSELPDPDTGQPYYYNQISGRMLSVRPEPPERVPLDDDGGFLLLEEEEDRVMPTRRQVLAAGRYDLHHAINYHGGYREVTAQLARQPSWPGTAYIADLAALAAELASHAADAGPPDGLMPSSVKLRDAGRTDLLSAIYRFGGFSTVARELGLQPQRRRRRRWDTMEDVAAEVLEFVRSSQGHDPGAWHMPTHAQLLAGGRRDLLYALHRHTSAAVARRLGLRLKRSGRRGRRGVGDAAPSGKRRKGGDGRSATS